MSTGVTRLWWGDVQVFATPGELVAKGKPLFILEAMKMEVGAVALCVHLTRSFILPPTQHIVKSPAEARVAKIHFQQGDIVSEGKVLLEFERG